MVSAHASRILAGAGAAMTEAPDHAALLVRRRRPIGEPTALTPTRWPVAATLEGTAGAGRVCLALAERGIEIETIVQLVLDPAVTPDDLAPVDLGRRFVTVVLGSHLVNVPDKALRRASLRVVARHVVEGGRVLVEHHPLDWAETAEPTPSTPGAGVGMVDVQREPPFVSAVSTYDIGGRTVRQPFTARVLSEEELRAALGEADLVVRRRLGPTWLEAAVDPR